MVVQEIKKGQVWYNIHNNHKVTIDKVEDDFVYLVGGYVTDALSFIDNWKIDGKESNETPKYELFGITSDKVVQSVINDLNERSKIGVNKYNTTLERTDLELKDWLQHAYEETLDKANYLKRAILELEK